MAAKLAKNKESHGDKTYTTTKQHSARVFPRLAVKIRVLRTILTLACRQ